MNKQKGINQREWKESLKKLKYPEGKPRFKKKKERENKMDERKREVEWFACASALLTFLVESRCDARAKG